MARLMLAVFFCTTLQDNNTPREDRDDGRTVATATAYAQISVRFFETHSISRPRPLTLKIANVGKAPIYYEYGYAEWSFDVEVLDGKGKPVPLTRHGAAVHRRYSSPPNIISGHGMQIDPGQAYQLKYDVQRIFDLSIPGTYTLSVRNNGAFWAQVSPGTGVVLENGFHDGGSRTLCDLGIERITIKVTE